MRFFMREQEPDARRNLSQCIWDLWTVARLSRWEVSVGTDTHEEYRGKLNKGRQS